MMNDKRKNNRLKTSHIKVKSVTFKIDDVKPVNHSDNTIPVASGSSDSEIVRHGPGTFESFTLRENELEKIENYTWGGRFFDFGITCVSVFVALLIAVTTCENMKVDIRAYFNFAMVICVIGGIAFFIQAYRRSKDRKEFFKRIREREVV